MLCLELGPHAWNSGNVSAQRRLRGSLKTLQAIQDHLQVEDLGFHLFTQLTRHWESRYVRFIDKKEFIHFPTFPTGGCHNGV